MVIGLSSNRRVAWCTTPLRYTVSFADEITHLVIRHTDLLTKHADRWFIVVTHYSLALPAPTVLYALTTGRLPRPRPIGDACGPGTGSLVEQFTDQPADLSTAAISHDAWACGPLPDEQATGGTAVHALFVAWTRRWGMFRLRGDGMHAHLAPGGKIGWVGANVAVQTHDAQQQVTLPLRMMVVYRKVQLVWEAVQAHVSVGIPDAVVE
jgi:hypothetical protein